VGVDELLAYLRAETPYPDLPTEEILADDLLVLHELVEINELKAMGLSVDDRIILDHLPEVLKAHVRAAELELEAAVALGALDHLRGRLRCVEAWTQDPNMPPELRERCLALLERFRPLVA